MDDVVDLEEEKINQILIKIENDPEPEEIKAIEKNLWLKIKEKLLQGRRTGLSGIGLADTLAMLGLSYSGGINVAESIYKNLAISAYQSSIDMAKDRGAFPIWDYNTEIKNPFINRIFNSEEMMSGYNPEVEEGYIWDFAMYGRRNISILTIPPSGTISLLAGISSGVEPIFMLHHKRKRKVNPDHPNITFVDKKGDCWEEYIVWHKGFKDWWDSQDFEDNGFYLDDIKYNPEILKSFIEKSPYYNSTAYELNPLDRVKMQSIIQLWVDHSISSTINLPKEATEEDVSNIYIQAWKLGCKGVTIYRESSRDGVLTAVDSKPEITFNVNNAPKRPKVLLGDVYTPSIHNNEYLVVVGLFDGKPYEIFACKNVWGIKGNYACTIIKRGRGKYDVDVRGVMLIEDITSDMTQIEESTTRLVSTSLRHGADIKFLVEQLLKARGNGFQDFSKIIARKLKHYIKDNEKVTGATCENCGSSNLIYVGGCNECKDCGSSKCG